MDTQSVLIQDISVRARDVDLGGRLSMQSLFYTMQEAAFDHSRLLGCGPAQMNAWGLAWVLSRVSVVMTELPRVWEDIRVTTWPGTAARLLYPRHFVFERANGVRIGAASTLWVVLDTVSRRLSPLGEGVTFPDTSALPAPLPPPGKLIMPDLSRAGVRRAQYGDIDIQGHVSNARYAAWVCDLFPAQTYQARAMTELHINYLSETAPDAEVELFMAQDGPAHCMRGVSGKTVKFEARAAFAGV